jgi:hypothetical protein
MSDETNDLLRILIELTARKTHSDRKVRELVGNNMVAYNLCDGMRTQADVVRELKLNQGNFSRAATRWMAAGILFRIGGPKGKLLHAYPLSKTAPKQKEGNQNE